jgi:iron-sulfur cluster assembly protein
MLTLTTEAVIAIQSLVSDQEGAGLRISSRSDDGNRLQLAVAVVEAPAPTDEIIEGEGSFVFVDEHAAPLIDGRTLDARSNPDEGISFSLI